MGDIVAPPVELTDAHPPHTVALDEPIVRGSVTLTHITVRKPKAGALRGLSVKQLINGDTDQLLVLLPRITEILPHEVSELEPADLVQFAAEVMDFLLPKAVKDSLAQ